MHEMSLPSDPDPRHCDLASRIYLAGKARLGAEAASYSDPDELSDALIDVGCREVQSLDERGHGGRLRKGSLGSQAQYVMDKERERCQPEPRVAQLVRHRVHAEWQQDDPRLNRLADQVIELGLGSATSATGGMVPPIAAATNPEATARHALDAARRLLAAAEGNHVAPGGDAAEVDAAFETFDPPIRRHALADIVVRKLQQQAAGKKLASPQPVTHGGVMGTEP